MPHAAVVRRSVRGPRVRGCSSWDGTLRLWDLSSGETTRSFIGHEKDVLSVAFSADNRHIVSGSRDKTLRLWNTLVRAWWMRAVAVGLGAATRSLLPSRWCVCCVAAPCLANERQPVGVAVLFPCVGCVWRGCWVCNGMARAVRTVWDLDSWLLHFCLATSSVCVALPSFALALMCVPVSGFPGRVQAQVRRRGGPP